MPSQIQYPPPGAPPYVGKIGQTEVSFMDRIGFQNGRIRLGSATISELRLKKTGVPSLKVEGDSIFNDICILGTATFKGDTNITTSAIDVGSEDSSGYGYFKDLSAINLFVYDDICMDSNGAIIKMGKDNPVTMTHSSNRMTIGGDVTITGNTLFQGSTNISTINVGSTDNSGAGHFQDLSTINLFVYDDLHMDSDGAI